MGLQDKNKYFILSRLGAGRIFRLLQRSRICFVRGLGSVDVAALHRFVVEDSKLDVEVPEIADGGTRA